MKIYTIKAEPTSPEYGLMAQDEDGYCYLYLANTGLWHRDGDLELDFEYDHESVYEQINAQEAAQLITGVRAIDRRSLGDFVQELENQAPRWKKTSAEVGLVDVPGVRPIGGALVDLAIARRKGTWTTAANYPIERKRTAQKLVSELQRKDRKIFRGQPFEAKVKTKAEVVSVLVRPSRDQEPRPMHA